ncbi:MAG: hypothetical protein HY098_08915 [Nitrospinae bacterium]|nr:hypothetical protein [Nitrospinota bacterium]
MCKPGIPPETAVTSKSFGKGTHFDPGLSVKFGSTTGGAGTGSENVGKFFFAPG